MSHYSRAALDSYITGNYGEDQFEGDVPEAEIEQSLRVEHAYDQGALAYKDGKVQCPYLSRLYSDNWAKGWESEQQKFWNDVARGAA